MKQTGIVKRDLIGKWSITKMSEWGDDYINGEVKAFIKIEKSGIGEFHFGYVQCSMSGDFKKIGENKNKYLRQVHNNIKVNNMVDYSDISFVLVSFLYSRDIIEHFDDYHTLTGFTWEESADLAVKLIREVVKLSDKKSIEIDKKDKELLYQILNFISDNSVYKKSKIRIGEEILELKKIIDDFNKIETFSKEQIMLLVISSVYIKDIMGWNNFEKVVGISWDDSTDLIVRMIKLI